MNAHVLDNPVWNALVTVHGAFAEGEGLARRYIPSHARFCAILEPSPAAFEALARLLGPGGTGVLFLPTEIEPLPDGWTRAFTARVSQMVCTTLNDGPEIPARVLGAPDIDATLELTRLTEPGPFKGRAVELGTYLGVHDAGNLVAMAGERFRCPGFTEISAVCTHPDYRGRGHASSLIHRLAVSILARGETPFLHVLKDNTKAIRVYRVLGFEERREMWALALKAPA